MLLILIKYIQTFYLISAIEVQLDHLYLYLNVYRKDVKKNACYRFLFKRI
jgi:hypothetical protein